MNGLEITKWMYQQIDGNLDKGWMIDTFVYSGWMNGQIGDNWMKN